VREEKTVREEVGYIQKRIRCLSLPAQHGCSELRDVGEWEVKKGREGGIGKGWGTDFCRFVEFDSVPFQGLRSSME